MVAAYWRVCKDRSIPFPGRFDLDIFSTQAKNLIRGGYDEADIVSEAGIIASEFSLIHGHKQMTQLQRRVQQIYEDKRIAEHEAVKFAPVSPQAAAAMGRLKRMPRKFEAPPVKVVIQPASPGGKCATCRHYEIEHGKGRCQTCEGLGRACAA